MMANEMDFGEHLCGFVMTTLGDVESRRDTREHVGVVAGEMFFV